MGAVVRLSKMNITLAQVTVVLKQVRDCLTTVKSFSYVNHRKTGIFKYSIPAENVILFLNTH